VRVSLLGCMT